LGKEENERRSEEEEKRISYRREIESFGGGFGEEK